MMLAFIGAGISPACKFISGQMIEICGPNGVETVRLAADELPPEQQKHSSAEEQCAFCFTGSHIKTAAAPALTIAVPDFTYVAVEREIATTLAYKLHHSSILPRGPPQTV